MKKNHIKALLTAVAFGFASATGMAQTVEGASYYLPKTLMKFSLMIEKKTYTPGDLAPYASRYLRRDDVALSPSTEYRIVGIRLEQKAEPDTAKFYTARIDSKHSIRTLERDENGVLLAINAKPRTVKKSSPFKPAPKSVATNPHDFMTQEILNAGSKAKMAELCVQEIYDIRENKGLLNKGQADFMPKDGEQLRIMLRNLDQQEAALLSLFVGTTSCDTVETAVDFVPTREVDKQLLFRFSKWLGLTDADDLAGSPYYIRIEDLHSAPSLTGAVADPKKEKDNIGVYVNLPGKIRATVYTRQKDLGTFELYAPQFGTTESLSGELFGRKFTSHLVLNPLTGSIESVETEAIK